jgi:hypothetical protein
MLRPVLVVLALVVWAGVAMGSAAAPAVAGTVPVNVNPVRLTDSPQQSTFDGLRFYPGGIGFGINAIIKFRQHKENPIIHSPIW